MFIAPLLITAAVGYWVLERAEHEKGRVRTIGRIVAALILLISAAGVACKVYAYSTGVKGWWCPMGKAGCALWKSQEVVPQPSERK